jgi:TRAP-type C4-dicarboxylate transport system substrate-binding protein
MNSLTKIAVVASFLFACLITPFAGSVTSAQAAKYKIRWLITHQTLDYFNAAALNFKKDVEQGSNGEISVEIETAALNDKSQAEVAAQIAGQVASGEAQMGHTFTNILGELDHRMWAFDLPYLIEGYGHQEAVFEGPLGPELLEGLRERGMVGLTFTYSGGAQGIATTEREIRNPQDLKGLKVGVFGNAVDNAWLSRLGATPVSLGHNLGQILPKTKDGTIDAVVVTWRRLHEARLHEKYKFVSMMNATHLTSISYINEKFLASLPQEYRTLIKESAVKAGRIERANTIALNETSKREMMSKGVRPVYLSDEGRQKFKQALKPVYKETLVGLVGESLIKRISKADPQHPYPDGADEEEETSLELALVRPPSKVPLALLRSKP